MPSHGATSSENALTFAGGNPDADDRRPMPTQAQPLPQSDSVGDAHLMVVLVDDHDACEVLRHGRRWHDWAGGRCTIVCIDTPETSLRRDPRRPLLDEFLREAQRAGAAVQGLSIDSHSTSALVAAIVHRARSEGATALLVGRPRLAGWWTSREGQRLHQFVDHLAEQLPAVTIHAVVPNRLPRQRSLAPAPRAGLGDIVHSGPRVALILSVCTAIGEMIGGWFEPANLLMVYLAGVVVAALQLGRAAALFSVLGSVFLFDLLFVEPRWSLKPTDPQYFFSFAVMLVVGGVISHLVLHAREHGRMSEARAQRAQALNQLSLQLTRCRDATGIEQALDAVLRGTLQAAARIIVPAPQQGGASVVVPALPALAAQAIALNRETGAGTEQGADDDVLYMPLPGSDPVQGLVAVSLQPGRRLCEEDQQLLRALVNQAAIALERVRFERLSVQAELAAESERLRNTLLAGISHDFRTPLTTIIGAASTLLEQGRVLDEEQHRVLLGNVVDEAQRLHALGSDLLDLTRLEAGAVRPQFEWCPVDELVQEAWAGLQGRTAGHTLVEQLQPELALWCDPVLVGQALHNLFDNALRHTPQGQAIVVEASSDGRHALLAVQDPGPGLPLGREQDVFRKFYRVADETDRRGTGLGLAICAAVATLHGGTVTAMNAEGARFELRWPQPSAAGAWSEALAAGEST